MQAQDTTADWLLKLWPWFEANAKRFLYLGVFAAIAVFLISFYSWRQNQRQVEAGDAFTQALTSGNGGQNADTFLKIAADYSGTSAGQRALLQGATLLFVAGKYADAQVQFQKFLDTYPDNSFAAQANLGVAASLDAQGKTDLAANAYQRVANQYSDGSVVIAAKFGLAQIYERQGKISDAQRFYEDVARTYQGSSMSSEAQLQLMRLRTKFPAAAAPASTTPAPFSLSH